ncbi:quinone oxidoreductase [Alcaligenes faecalis]|jgi:NADPH2:quinone reductase|uniref:quinone oxidoreductase family protein n=1 Tax=Alcaligenes faecalis TaxID=511 RepID=UPI0005A720E4|nr:quinone oxidoreductase [Alcaligenes faecalis]ATI00267.1 quinone oxidoreductase [Alcaligenes faecalis]AYZ93053.1 quinone oxidoreductase [Alcaligenes faecalis]MBQ0215781.1 quinone oxidoreductase [Alcaligenes faecalis]MBW4787949.1 quinone oxidoreductase [Alcaligenes faecalis subsp. faecalis]MBY6308960.1 quinone oxidoreductase [Alcaligenes faecalis]
MTQTVKAIRIERNGGPEVLQWASVELPAPQEKEVTIRQKAVGLNFIDIYFRNGLYSNPLPHGLGFEASGIVEAVGSGVTHLKVGDRVAYGQSPLGAYAEARNVPADRVVRIPDGITFEQAAAMMLKGLTCWYLLRQTYRVHEGQTILFHAAAGGVGLYACQWARALGVKLIGTVSSPEKAALAKENGAWEVIDYSHEDVVQRVLELTNGQKVPVVYDGVGKDTWERSLDCLQPRGLMVSFGNASGPVTGVNLATLASKGSLYVTRPVLGAYVPTQETMQAAADEMFELVLQGKIKPLIGQRFPLDQVAKAHEELAGRRTTGSTVLTLD